MDCRNSINKDFTIDIFSYFEIGPSRVQKVIDSLVVNLEVLNFKVGARKSMQRTAV